MGRLQVLLDPPVVMDLCRDRNGHGVSVLAAGKLPRPAVERRQSLASGVGLQPGTWRYYLPASRRERPLHCSQAAGLYGLAVQSHAKGKWQHTSPESRHLSSSTLPTHRLKPKHTPKRTTPSRKTGALLVHATTGPVSNRLRSPAKEHITEQRLNACGSHRTPAKVLLPRAICNSCRHTAAPVAPPSKPQHTTKRTHTAGVLQRICKLTTAWRRQLGRE